MCVCVCVCVETTKVVQFSLSVLCYFEFLSDFHVRLFEYKFTLRYLFIYISFNCVVSMLDLTASQNTNM